MSYTDLKGTARSTKTTEYQAFSPETGPLYVITRSVEVSAPIERVWRAVSDADEIAQWFAGVSAARQLEPGGHGIFVWSGHIRSPSGGGGSGTHVDRLELGPRDGSGTDHPGRRPGGVAT